MTRPRSLNRVVGCSSRWVPTRTSISPAASLPDDLVALGLRLEPGEHRDGHRELGEPLGEGLEVLVGQQRRRHQDGDLLAVLHRLERRPDGDLGLPVADVAADDPVHRDRLHHVGLDLVDGAELVGRLLEREGVLELALPDGVGAEGVPLGRHARGVEADQLGGDLLDRLARLALGVLPVGAAELGQRRRLAADVAGELVEGVGRHEQPVRRLVPPRRRVLDDQVVALPAVDGAADHLDVAADAVLLVDDEVAGLQLHEVDGVAPAGRHLRRVAHRGAALAGEVVLGEQRQADAGEGEAGLQVALGDVGQPGVGRGRRCRAPAGRRGRPRRTGRRRAGRGPGRRR